MEVDIDPNLHYDFTPLVGAEVDLLLHELADTHSALANLILRIGFLRQEELRGSAHAKVERISYEALRDAYTEKKWLLKALLDSTSSNA
jgi:hypothetical protein